MCLYEQMSRLSHCDSPRIFIYLLFLSLTFFSLFFLYFVLFATVSNGNEKKDLWVKENVKWWYTFPPLLKVVMTCLPLHLLLQVVGKHFFLVVEKERTTFLMTVKNLPSASSTKWFLSLFPGHTVMYSFLVFAFLGSVIALVSAILYFKRSKTSQKRRKHSKPEDEHSGTQIRPKMNERKERSFVKLTSFPTSITPVQV